MSDQESARDKEQYVVVINHEEQYSIWPADRAMPLGWSSTKFEGSKEQCLTHIERVWTDMRPRGVRLAMDGK